VVTAIRACCLNPSLSLIVYRVTFLSPSVALSPAQLLKECPVIINFAETGVPRTAVTTSPACRQRLQNRALILPPDIAASTMTGWRDNHFPETVRIFTSLTINTPTPPFCAKFTCIHLSKVRRPK